jgi:hypothetical protein
MMDGGGNKNSPPEETFWGMGGGVLFVDGKRVRYSLTG